MGQLPTKTVFLAKIENVGCFLLLKSLNSASVAVESNVSVNNCVSLEHLVLHLADQYQLFLRNKAMNMKNEILRYKLFPRICISRQYCLFSYVYSERIQNIPVHTLTLTLYSKTNVKTIIC